MPHLPLSYRVVGEDDYMLEIEVAADGCFSINSGDHTSHKPRRGSLTPSQKVRLSDLLDQIGDPREHLAPVGASGFMATLTLGDAGPGQIRKFRFWEGALLEDPGLEAVVRALEVL
jgi:hypothetical protein